MERIILWQVRHPRFVLVLTAALLGLGIWSVIRTPMDALPDISENQILVYTAWPDEQPPVIEQQVTRPLADALAGIPGLTSIRGSSDVGFSLLHLLFEDHLTFLEARERVAEKLRSLQLSLPEGVAPKLAAEGIPTGQIFWYTVEGKGTDLAELRRVQDEQIAPALSQLAGVAEVASVGGFQAELHFQLDLEKLAASGTSLATINEVLRDDQTIAANKALLDSVGRWTLGHSPRAGVYEKEGSEVVAGVVHLKFGANPLEVTQRVLDRLVSLSDELPSQIRVVPCYDRTPLIRGAVRTVTSTLLESILVTTLGVILILRHARTSLVITLTLPLAIFSAFLAMAGLRSLGIVDIQTNIMSLAGIVVSIGVLVDSAIVITDNVTHELHHQFGDHPIDGDTSTTIARACAKVGWPAFLSILVMLVSFLPIFALRGIDGRMYAPLAWTKALSLASVALLTLTVIPVLCRLLIRGRVHKETDSAVIRGFIQAYRPMLRYLLDHPFPLVLFLVVVTVLGAATTGIDWLVRTLVGIGLVASVFAARNARTMAIGVITVVVVGLAGPAWIQPLRLETRIPLDEGIVMDMPITIPNISVAQAVDDLKARNMILCRFPEVAMASGKAGRAETAFDPAPMEMIESMVEFRARELWPHRRLLATDATLYTQQIIDSLVSAQLVDTPTDPQALTSAIVSTSLPRFDAIQREICYQRLRVFQSDLGRELVIALTRQWTHRLHQNHLLESPLTEIEIHGLASMVPHHDLLQLGHSPDRLTVVSILRRLKAQLASQHRLSLDQLTDDPDLNSTWETYRNRIYEVLGLDSVSYSQAVCQQLQSQWRSRWRQAVRELNAELRQRAVLVWTQLVCSELVTHTPILDESLQQTWTQIFNARHGKQLVGSTAPTLTPAVGTAPATGHHHDALPSISKRPMIDPHRQFDALMRQLRADLEQQIWLWPHDRESLAGQGGELDQAVQMPGWANVWTRPIQNRVDMLASGVNSEMGIRVTGDSFDAVVTTSEKVADVLRMIDGAVNVIADPIRGKDYFEFQPDTVTLERLHLSQQDRFALDELSSHGRIVGQSTNVPTHLAAGTVGNDLPVRLKVIHPSREDLGSIRVTSGPATIKSENGKLRNYVRLNIKDRDPSSLIAEAQSEISKNVVLPNGVSLEWTGQYLHAAETRQRLLWIVPVVLSLICFILYLVFRNWTEVGLVLLAVPGVLAGGALCQWLLGVPFSIAVGIGYIACFGMAAATGIIMLVYLRSSVIGGGGPSQLSDLQLRARILDGATYRLRPKLLTEATMICSLIPMLWSTGAGADVIRPMAAPVLGGILIADEIIDLLLPVLYYRVCLQRRRAVPQADQHDFITE